MLASNGCHHVRILPGLPSGSPVGCGSVWLMLCSFNENLTAPVAALANHLHQLRIYFDATSLPAPVTQTVPFPAIAPLSSAWGTSWPIRGRPHWSAPQAVGSGTRPQPAGWLSKTSRTPAPRERPVHRGRVSGSRADISARGLEFNQTRLAPPLAPGSAAKSQAGARRRRMVEVLLKRGAATNLPDDERGRLPWPGHGNSDWPISKRFFSSTGLTG